LGKRPGGKGEASEGRRKLGGRAGGLRSDLGRWGDLGRPVEASGPQEVIGELKRDKASQGKALGMLGKAIEGPARALEGVEGFRSVPR
jgi:hypothetical protein